MKLRSFILTSGSYGLAEVIARAVQAVTMFWAAAVCTKQTFGEIALLISIQQAIILFGVGGTVEAMSGHLQAFRRDGRLRNLFASTKWVVILGCLAGIILYAVGMASFGESLSYRPDKTLQILVIVSGLWIAWLQLKSNIQRLQENHRFAILLKTIPIILIYAGAMSGVVLSATPAGYLIGTLGGLMVASVAIRLLLPSLDNDINAASKDTIAVVAKDSLPFLVAGLLAWMSGYGVNLLINSTFSTAVVAEFALVFSLNAILLLVANSVNQVWSPRFLQLAVKKDADQLDRANTIANRISLYMIGVVAALIITTFPEFVKSMPGNLSQYANIHPYLLISFSTYIGLTVYYRSINYYLLERAGPIFMRLSIYSTLAGLALWVVLVWWLGIWGIYIGLMVTTLLRGGAIYLYARDRWKISMDWVDILFAQSLLVAAYFSTVEVSSVVLRLVLVVMLFLLVIVFRLFRRQQYMGLVI